MSRWQRSKALTKASWAVVRQERELLVLPLLSGAACVAMALLFAIPIVLTSKDGFGPVGAVITFVMYLVLAYITIYFRTAVLSAADEAMRGGSPSLSSAIEGANDRAGKIFPWALVSATVSVVLRAIQERAGFVGRLVVGLIGAAWAVVTFLVLPVIVFEGLGVGDAIKKSAAMLKRTWGENLIVNGGIGLIAFLLMLPAIAIGAAAIASGVAAVIVVGLVIAAVWILAVACWSSAMTGVFQVALYRYAATGETVPAFATVNLGDSFRSKDGGPTGGGAPWATPGTGASFPPPSGPPASGHIPPPPPPPGA